MKHFITVLALLTTIFSTAQISDQTIQVGAVTRSYKLYVPIGFNPATETPRMVFILHGIGGNPAQMVSAGFNFIADTARVIVVYPQGVTNSFGQTSWNNGTGLSSTADDITFFNLLINKGLTDFNVNPAKVFVTGFSMGSIMSHHLACALNNRIAAVGTMAGTMATSDISTCNPAYKTPVIHLHGTADGTVPYAGSALPTLSLVAETMSFWKTQHGCASTADSTRLPDIAADGITVDRFVYDNCTTPGALELWRFNGADHIYLYQPLNDITELLEVWRFFNKWQHPNPSTLTINEGSEKMKFSISPNPSAGSFQITTEIEQEVTLFTIQGQKINDFKLEAGMNAFNLQIEKGSYLLRTNSGVQTLIIE